jgi:hypothetical protein
MIHTDFKDLELQALATLISRMLIIYLNIFFLIMVLITIKTAIFLAFLAKRKLVKVVIVLDLDHLYLIMMISFPKDLEVIWEDFHHLNHLHLVVMVAIVETYLNQ